MLGTMDKTQNQITSIFLQTGRILTRLSQLLLVILGSGMLFMFLTFKVAGIVERPEISMKLEGVHLNYQEFSAPEEQEALDPSWDGTIAGLSLGYSYGNFMPIIGPVAGPIFGAILGYQMDSQI